MSQVASLSKALEFNMMYASEELRKSLPMCDYVVMAYSQITQKVITNYFNGGLVHTDRKYIVFLNHEHYDQYQLIKHLPWDNIVEYFVEITGENNTDITS